MVAESLVESIRVRDAASCRAWLARLSAVDGSRLSSVDRLLRNLSRSQEAPDLVLEIVEQARPVHLEELSGVFDRLDAGAFPLAEPDRQRFVTAVASLELGRDLYKQLHAALVDDGDAAAHARIPGAAASLRAVMPLARALDYQARLLLALQRLKVIVEPNDWDELCTLARKIRASTFMDVAVPDDVPLLRSMTARALFVCPLLVMLARPETRTPAEFAVISRLARRWAGRVGFRLEDAPLAHDGKYGPSTSLTSGHWVRLVTHRLQRRLEERRRELDKLGPKSVPKLPRGLSLDQTRALLDDLQQLWVAPRTAVSAPDIRLGEMQLRFGFPQLPAPPKSPGRSGKPMSWSSAASRAYIYGRFEQNTIIRMALGDQAAGDDPLLAWASGALPATWVSIERQQAVFEFSASAGKVELGGLVMVVAPPVDTSAAESLRHPESEPSPKRMFGRVVSMSQRVARDPRAAPIQRVGVTVWSSRPSLVGLRVGDDPFFHDAFLLPADPAGGEPTCVIAPAGSFRSPDHVTMREAIRDLRVHFDALADRGPGYDRVLISRPSS